jgi:8-oxo-dGTP pyrophosphatase MutT (NUDIX family)
MTGGSRLRPSPREALAAALRGVLLQPAAAARIRVPGARQAAVLVPLYLDAAGAVHAVFTRRNDDLRRHAGEVSFPGGRRDEEDADLCATALRETHEEIGLPPAAVELVGALQPTPTFVTDYGVYPFVGLIEPGFAWAPAHREVAAVLELPLEAVRAGYARRRLERRGLPFRTDTYVVGDHLIWGATARIVADLLDRVAPARGY